MGILKKRRIKGDQIIVDAVSATASRAIYTGHESMPNLEFRFQTQDGNVISEVVIEMNLTSATTFLNQAISAHQVSTPHLTRQYGPIGG